MGNLRLVALGLMLLQNYMIAPEFAPLTSERWEG